MINPLRVRFVRHVLMGSGLQAFQALLAMIAGVLVARVLGTSARGTLSVLVALGSMGVLVGSLGVHLSGVYFLGRFKSERDKVMSNNLTFGIVGGLATAGLLAVTGVVFHADLLDGIPIGLFLVFVCSTPFNYFNEFGRALLFGDARIRASYVPDGINGGGLLLLTAAALVVFGHHIAPLVVTRVLIDVGTTVFIVAAIRRGKRFKLSLSGRLVRTQLRYGLRNYGSSLLWLLLLQSDIVLCNSFLGSRPTGVYSVATSLAVPITLLAGVIGQLTFQRVSAEDSRAIRIANTNRAIRLLLPLAVLATILLAVVAIWLVPFVYGHQFSGAIVALDLLLPGLLAYCLEIVLMNFLAGEGSPMIVVFAPLAGLAINVVANLFVIPRWGINGASVTSSVAYVAVLLLALQYYCRTTGSSLRDVFRTRRDDVEAVFGRRLQRDGDAVVELTI